MMLASLIFLFRGTDLPTYSYANNEDRGVLHFVCEKRVKLRSGHGRFLTVTVLR
jgi:hypothetical protein